MSVTELHNMSHDILKYVISILYYWPNLLPYSNIPVKSGQGYIILPVFELNQKLGR